MKNKIACTLLSGFLLMGLKGYSQDKMILRGKIDTLVIKVLELGVDEVRYKTWPVEEDMPVMVEKKERIRKIIFANGTVMKFAEDEFSNAANYANQRKMLFKMDLFSPIRKVFSGSFEYSIRPGMSTEFGIGVIGLGTYENSGFAFNEADGGFIRVGIKFINQPDYHMKGMRYTHILKGGYIRPELIYLYQENFGGTGYYGYNYNVPYNLTITTRGFAGFVNFGKQWVFSDVFCVDLFLGLGIGSKNYKMYKDGVLVPTNNNSGIFDYGPPIEYTGGFGYLAMSSTNGAIAFCMQSGLKLGVLIGSKNKGDK